MQFLFSIISLVVVVGVIMWWGFRDAPIVTAPTDIPSETSSGVASQNPITDPIERATEAKQILESRDLITLDLSEQALIKVPEYLFGRTNLESLDLSNNNLTGALQAEVRHLQNLKMLDLSGNKFTGVPAEIGQLKNLEILNLSNNLLTGLPYELGNLSNLKTLDLSGNNYSEADLNVIKKSLPASTVIITN